MVNSPRLGGIRETGRESFDSEYLNAQLRAVSFLTHAEIASSNKATTVLTLRDMVNAGARRWAPTLPRVRA